MDVKELVEKRLKLIADARSLLEAAEKENRSLTSEEQARYDAMMADEAELRQRIERWAELEKRSQTELPVWSKQTTTRDVETTDYNKAFYRYVRHGLSGLDAMEVRALSVGTGSAGGYLVPRSLADKIVEKLVERNFVRRFATVIQTESPHDIPIEASLPTASWISEAAAFTESEPRFAQKTLGAHKLGIITTVSEELLNDAAFDVEGYLALKFGNAIGTAEQTAFLVGTGTGQPKGIVADAGIGVTAAANNAITADELISLYYSLESPYRENAIWVMRDSTVAAIRKLKDSQGQYLWQPSLTAGSPETLLGRPVFTSSAMAAIGPQAKSVLFADFSFYYIADRGQRSMQRLVELYAATGQVGFRAWERVDGVLTLTDAAKVLVHPL